MNEIMARNMQSSQGIINYPTQLHLVGHFHIYCVMMHGNMNIKPIAPRLQTCTACYCTEYCRRL